MVSNKQLNYQSVLDGLGQGVLIFDSEDRLVMENLAARTLLGTDLKLIRASGWAAASTLFSTRPTESDESVETARKKALESARPVRFHIYRSGEHVPCWAAGVHGEGGEVFTMITIESSDWAALSELMNKFRDEVETAASATQGHTHLIFQTLKTPKKGEIGRATQPPHHWLCPVDCHAQPPAGTPECADGAPGIHPKWQAG